MAKLARLDLSTQPVRRRRHRSVELCFQHFRNGKTDVETDPIRQFDWADRHTEPLGGSIDGFGGHFLVEQQHRLEHIGCQRTVHEEARCAFDRKRQSIDLSDEASRRGENVRAHAGVAHHFDELHARHGIEKMQADEPFRSL